jgi:mannose-6-phosphate isomerase-like protein (cupin superfamily)
MQITHATKSRWFLPLFAVALGVVMFVAQWIGGDPTGGLVSLGIMTVFGAVVLFGGGSETIRGLRGDGRDERFRQIDITATAIAGTAVITAVIIAFVVELARGHDGTPYVWLGALGGVASSSRSRCSEFEARSRRRRWEEATMTDRPQENVGEGSSAGRLIDLDDLPRSSNSHVFTGAEHGDIPLSFFIVRFAPGTGPSLHRHEYPEVFVIEAGEATFRVAGKELVARRGQIVIAPANCPHGFTNTGSDELRLTAIHAAREIVTEWLETERESD